MLQSAERPLIVAGGGIINADACELLVEFAEITGVPVIPTLMGWGAIPDDHPLMAGMVGPADQPPLRQRDAAGERLRARHRQPLGQPPHRLGRGLHQGPHASCTSTSSRRRSAACSSPISASSPTPRRRSNCFVAVARERKAARRAARTFGAGAAECRERKRTMLRKTHFEETPIKPQRVYEEMNKAFGATLATSRRSAFRRSPARSSCTSTIRATGSIAARPARWAGRFPPRSACASPRRTRRSWRFPATTTSSSSSRSWPSARNSSCPMCTWS